MTKTVPSLAQKAYKNAFSSKETELYKNKLVQSTSVIKDLLGQVKNLEQEVAALRSVPKTNDSRVKELEKQVADLQKELNDSDLEAKKEAVAEALTVASQIKKQILDQAEGKAKTIVSDAQAAAQEQSKDIVDAATKVAKTQEDKAAKAQGELSLSMSQIEDLRDKLTSILEKEPARPAKIVSEVKETPIKESKIKEVSEIKAEETSTVSQEDALSDFDNILATLTKNEAKDK